MFVKVTYQRNPTRSQQKLQLEETLQGKSQLQTLLIDKSDLPALIEELQKLV